MHTNMTGFRWFCALDERGLSNGRVNASAEKGRVGFVMMLTLLLLVTSLSQ